MVDFSLGLYGDSADYTLLTLCLLITADVDDCSRLGWSCENGGQAVDTGKSCQCQCTANYTGEHCERGEKLVELVLGNT